MSSVCQRNVGPSISSATAVVTNFMFEPGCMLASGRCEMSVAPSDNRNAIAPIEFIGMLASAIIATTLAGSPVEDDALPPA